MPRSRRASSFSSWCGNRGVALVLTGLVECESCELVYQGEWADNSDTLDDMAEAPEQTQYCPGCGHPQDETWPGWAYRSEAGLHG